MHYSKTNNPRSVIKFGLRRKLNTTGNIPAVPKRSANRLSRLMALAIRFEDMLRCGEVADYSELAVRYGVDRSRVSRVMHLRLLAPDLQELLLAASAVPESLCLKHVMPVCKIASWNMQRKRFKKLASN